MCEKLSDINFKIIIMVTEYKYFYLQNAVLLFKYKKNNNA